MKTNKINNVNIGRIRFSIKLLVIVLFISGSAVINSNAQSITMNSGTGQPSFKWVTDTVMTLGKIEINKPQTVTFEFINKGNAPLLIRNVQPSCGCTAVEYSKNPVAPGEKGFVKTTYNAATTGIFHKTLTVYSNSPEYSRILAIKGEVITKK